MTLTIADKAHRPYTELPPVIKNHVSYELFQAIFAAGYVSRQDDEIAMLGNKISELMGGADDASEHKAAANAKILRQMKAIIRPKG